MRAVVACLWGRKLLTVVRESIPPYHATTTAEQSALESLWVSAFEIKQIATAGHVAGGTSINVSPSSRTRCLCSLSRRMTICSTAASTASSPRSLCSKTCVEKKPDLADLAGQRGQRG